MDQRSTASLKKKAGFSLIEVLMTLSIVSVGLLAILAAQLKNVQQSNDLSQRHAAMMAVKEMTNRIKANFVEARAIYGTFGRPASGSVYNVVWLSGGAQINGGCTSDFCTPTQLAQTDLFEMYNIVHTIPGYHIMRVCLDSTDYTAASPGECSCNGTPLTTTQYTTVDGSASFTKSTAIYCVSIKWQQKNAFGTLEDQYYRLTVRP